MIHALILPYVQRPGLAGCEITIIAEERERLGLPAIVEQHEIGRVVDLTDPRPVQRRHRREQWQTKERVITDDDVRDAIAWAQSILLRYGVTSFEVRTATGDSVAVQRSQRIGAAMEAGLYLALPGPQEEPTFSVISADTPEVIERSDVEHTITVTLPEYPREIAVTMTPIPAGKQGTRILGVDPGSHWVACVVAEQCGEELVYITSRVFEIGRVVPVRPRTITRKDGSTYTIATKREITDADIGALLRAVMAWLEPLQVDRAVLERASHFRTDAPSEGAGGARAAGLARAQWIGGELAGTLRIALYDAERGADNVQTVASVSWRATARKGIQSVTTAAAWREGIQRAFGASWPVSIGEHALDAAGCIVWAVRGPAARTAEPRPARPKVERPKRTAADAHAARDAKAARKRAQERERGCQCHGRHRRECPLFRPMTYRKG
jgi:hypothetical protein